MFDLGCNSAKMKGTTLMAFAFVLGAVVVVQVAQGEVSRITSPASLSDVRREVTAKTGDVRREVASRTADDRRSDSPQRRSSVSGILILHACALLAYF